MNVSELLASARQQINDRDRDGTIPQSDLLWTDAALIQWCNEGEAEACIRADLLRDSRSALCSVTSTGADVALDARVLSVLRATLNARPLTLTTQADLDADWPGWETAAGTPSHVVTDVGVNLLRLVPAPLAPVTLALTVMRLPLKGLSPDVSTQAPEIPAQYHASLVDWMCYRALSDKDLDGEDSNRAMAALARFERVFGPPLSARYARINRRGRVRPVYF